MHVSRQLTRHEEIRLKINIMSMQPSVPDARGLRYVNFSSNSFDRHNSQIQFQIFLSRTPTIGIIFAIGKFGKRGTMNRRLPPSLDLAGKFLQTRRFPATVLFIFSITGTSQKSSQVLACTWVVIQSYAKAHLSQKAYVRPSLSCEVSTESRGHCISLTQIIADGNF